MLLVKVVRDMWGNKKSYISCICLIIIGVLIYNSMGIALGSMLVAADKYYKDSNFADVFSQVSAIPASKIANLSHIKGVDNVLGRTTKEARIIGLDNKKVITVKLIGITENTQTSLNSFVYEGSEISKENDIMLSKDFMLAHKLEIGNKITAIINNKSINFTICAMAQSPEYIYAIKNETEILPDPSTYSYGFVDEKYLQTVAKLNGAYNDVSFALEKGYAFDDVKILLEDELSNYGLLMLVPKKDQTSYNMLKMELTQSKAMTFPITIVFISMAMIVLYLMLRRLIEKDRTQVGTLKAFGYSNSKILLSYMLYGIITGAIGGILGSVLGYISAGSLITMYLEYYKVPNVTRTSSLSYFVSGILIAIIGGALGAYSGARRVINLRPAEAMRPAAPVVYAKSKFLGFLGDLNFNKKIIGIGFSMAIRGISRNKFRSLFIVLGIVFSFSIITIMGSFSYMVDAIIINQFSKVQKYDAKLIYNSPVLFEVGLGDINKFSEISQSEGVYEATVTLKKDSKKEIVNITGIQQNSELYKIYDNDLKKNKTLKDGLIISNSLAKRLKVKKGDFIIVESMNADKTTKTSKILIDDTVEQNLGFSVYMNIESLCKLQNTRKMISGVIFNSSNFEAVKSKTLEAKNVSLIENKNDTLQKYNNMMAPYGSIMYIGLIMSILVAFAIIYNTGVISMSEREREYATLRVLGMHIKQIASIVSFEYWVLCFFGVLLGFLFTFLLKQAIANSIDMQSFSFPTATPIYAYFMGILGCMFSVFLGNISAKRRIAKFGMVEVLKERQ